MAVTDDRKYTGAFVYQLLESIKGKTLGEVDKSHQFARTEKSQKITGIAGDVIEQSVFGYTRDSNQECDIEIDGLLTELKTTGVRIPKSDLNKTRGKTGESYNVYLAAKEGISITGVTFEPDIQRVFETSHFWEKSERLLIVFYEYKGYDVVPASSYADFPIVDYCYNTFSEEERLKLKRDWEVVRDFLCPIYEQFVNTEERNQKLEGFTHLLRPQLLLMELVPGFKKKDNTKNGVKKASYQKPRYRLKQTFVDYIVRGHFDRSRTKNEIQLQQPFSSFAELDLRCHTIAQQYAGKTFVQLKEELGINIDWSNKDFGARCVLHMFGANCNRLNQISDFNKAGIIVKTITLASTGSRTEDMKMKHIDFEEWADRDIDFQRSELYTYFCEHSFLCPIFCENVPEDVSKTTFLGFKRFAFDDAFIYGEVKRMWDDSRHLIHTNQLEWEYLYTKDGERRKNHRGFYMGAPNFPKSSEYNVFFRGGANVSTEETRTECVNGIYMLPQYFWLKGAYIANKLKEMQYL